LAWFLAHIDIDEKSNEIPAAQQLVGEFHIAHSTVTLDALQCQKNLRGCRASPGAADCPTEGQLAHSDAKKAETAYARQHLTSSDTAITKARNRRETRTVDVFSATRAVANTEWDYLIKGIVRVSRDVLHRSARTGLWSSTSEVAYYLAGFAGSAR
jgi:predicted transposase YbfD/YdcC